MRVLVVVHGFPPTAEGGAEYHAAAHARALARSGDDVLVLTREADARRPEFSLRRDEWHGLPVVRVNNTFRQTRSMRDAYADERIAGVVAPVIRRFAPDVAHLHHLTCLSTGIVTLLGAGGVPMFYTLHDYWLLCHRGQLLDVDLRSCDGPGEQGCGRCIDGAAAAVSRGGVGRAGRHVVRRLPSGLRTLLQRGFSRVARDVASDAGRQAEAHRRLQMRATMAAITHFLAPSASIRDVFVRSGVEASRITLHAYGFEASRRPFDPEAAIERARRPLRLGFLGSLMVAKGPQVLIDACALLPPGAVTLDLYGAFAAYHGDDRFATELSQRTRAPWIRVHGPIAHDAVGEALGDLDVLVVPSIWRENSPLVIREAFLTGVPVVASRIGGIPEVVDEGRGGLLFAAGDAADLARVLRRLVEEPALLPQLRRAIPSVRHIDDDAAVTRTMYLGVLAKPATGRGGHTPALVVDVRPRLAAIVLNYRAWGDTLHAVRSLLLSTRPVDDLIVVDNDGGDNAAAILGPLRTNVHWIPTARNLGYTGGMNAGMRAALDRGADLILLVNSDVVVPVGAVGQLEEAMTSERAGIAGPCVLARHAPDVVASLGMSYHRRTGRMRHRGVGHSYVSVTGEPTVAVAGVSGCFMLIRRGTLDAIGLLDDDYFFGFEDLDLCLRARSAGHHTVIVPSVTVLHEGGRSIGAASPDRLRFAARNHLRLAAQPVDDDPPLGRAIRCANVVALNVAHAFRARGGTVAGRLAAVYAGIRDYVAGRVGPLSGS